MLLLEKANLALFFIMKVGCKFKFIPFSWNNKTNRFKKPTTWDLSVFYISSLPTTATFCFMVYRLFESAKIVMPPRMRVMNIIWGFAYSLHMVSKLQMHLASHEIMCFSNGLFDKREKQLELANAKAGVAAARRMKEGSKSSMFDQFRTVDGKGGFDWISIIVLIGLLLLIVNPPAHASSILDIPCAPHYYTSLILPCSWVGDNPVRILELLPYALIEIFLIGDIISNISFYWVTIFLGNNWIKDNLAEKETQNTHATDWSQPNGFNYMESVLEYRRFQVLTCYENFAFKLYLKAFPSLLFVLAASLIFGSIRFYHLPFYIYATFPACAFRCLFDGITQLGTAGRMNFQSELYLDKLKYDLSCLAHDVKATKYLKAFIRSSPKLCCKSGSLYTLEKSIVLVSLDNCVQLVFNLLVGYPKPDASQMTER